MAESRDDFVIAIRSAFLKKSNKQKFSLLTLIILSLIIIILGNFNFKIIQYSKLGIKEVIYRFTYITSIPENYFKKSYFKISEHINFYNEFKKNEILLNNLKEKKLSNDFLLLENKRLRKLIDESIVTEEIFAKVLVDNDSPYLKSIILNKGSKDKVKLGMAIVDGSYLVGKIIEVNFTNSRALLLSDLNSKIIVYTSGYGGLFKPGLPVGKIINKANSKKNIVNFFSDFGQLDYVKIVSYEIGSGN